MSFNIYILSFYLYLKTNIISEFEHKMYLFYNIHTLYQSIYVHTLFLKEYKKARVRNIAICYIPYSAPSEFQ